MEERLTKNVGDRYIANEIKLDVGSLSDSINRHNQQVYNKLGQVEDIEQEWNIPILTLKKALDPDTSIFVLERKGTIAEYDSLCFTNKAFDGKHLIVSDVYSGETMYLPLKDYGTNWAVSREEIA